MLEEWSGGMRKAGVCPSNVPKYRGFP